MSIAQVRRALAEALAPVAAASSPTLRVSPSWPGQLNPPAAVIRRSRGPEPESVVLFTVTFVIGVYVPASDVSSQDVLDQFLEAAGPTSITAAIKANSDLGGVVRSAIPGVPEEDQLLEFGGVQYLGAAIPVVIRHN